MKPNLLRSLRPSSKLEPRAKTSRTRMRRDLTTRMRRDLTTRLTSKLFGKTFLQPFGEIVFTLKKLRPTAWGNFSPRR